MKIVGNRRAGSRTRSPLRRAGMPRLCGAAAAVGRCPGARRPPSRRPGAPSSPAVALWAMRPHPRAAGEDCLLRHRDRVEVIGAALVAKALGCLCRRGRGHRRRGPGRSRLPWPTASVVLRRRRQRRATALQHELPLGGRHLSGEPRRSAPMNPRNPCAGPSSGRGAVRYSLIPRSPMSASPRPSGGRWVRALVSVPGRAGIRCRG